MMTTDPLAKVFLYQLGTDQLESKFSTVRTLTHAANCSLLELTQRFVVADQIQSVLNKYPDWKREKRREAFTNDHSSVTSWVGHLTTENLSHNSLRSIWINGDSKALEFLSSLDFDMNHIEIFPKNVNVRNPLNNVNEFENLTDELLNPELQESNTYQYFPEPQTNSPCEEVPNIVNSEYLDTSILENENHELNENVDQVSFLNSEISDTVTNQILRQEKYSNSYTHNDKLIYKSNAIASMIHNLTALHQSSILTNTDRTTRVYLRSLYANVEDEESELPSPSGQIMSPDYLATIIINKIDKTISLVFISITKITIGTELRTSIEHDELHKAKFNGMVISLTNIDSKYLYSEKNSQFIGTELRGVLGSLASPIKYNIETTFIDNKMTSKSKFDLIDINSILEYFRNVITKSPSLKLPSIKLATSNEIIKKTLLIESEKLTVNNFSLDKLKCKVCLLAGKDDVYLSRSLMRQHIGQHIVKQEVNKHLNLCGFCGTVCGSNNTINKNSSINSGCDHVHFYSAGPASKSSARAPCTNRLVLCPSCSQVVWSYNIGLHYEKLHMGIDTSIYGNLVATRAELMSVLVFGEKKRMDKNLTFKNLGNV